MWQLELHRFSCFLYLSRFVLLSEDNDSTKSNAKQVSQVETETDERLHKHEIIGDDDNRWYEMKRIVVYCW